MKTADDHWNEGFVAGFERVVRSFEEHKDDWSMALAMAVEGGYDRESLPLARRLAAVLGVSIEANLDPDILNEWEGRQHEESNKEINAQSERAANDSDVDPS